jgi:hypothetical protein
VGRVRGVRYPSASATAVGIVQDKRILSGRYGPTYELNLVFTDSMGDVHAYTGDVPRATYERRAPGAAT